MTISPSRSAIANWPPGSRRCSGVPGHQQPPADVYDDGHLRVSLDLREVGVDGTAVALTPTEFRLLAALIRHPGQILNPDQLLELAWNDPMGIGPDRVKFGVMRLRRKLGQAPGEPGPRSRRSAASATATWRPDNSCAR